MKLKISLNNSKSIDEAIRQIQQYQADLEGKVLLALTRLAEQGAQIAKANAGEYGELLVFTVETETEGGIATAYLVGADAQKIISRWMREGEVVEAEVSPILMSEFGSGQFAKNPLGVADVGRGTFPNQKHAHQSVWYWKEPDDDNLYSSSGFAPSQPMYNARNAMIGLIRSTFREVFNG